jgi:Xaa-Pro aminopeptidase
MSLRPEYADRIARLQTEMVRSGVDLVAVSPGATMRYLLGFSPLADERPCVLLISRSDLRLVAPALNAQQMMAHTGLDVLAWSDDQGPAEALQEAAAALGAGGAASDHAALEQDAPVRPGERDRLPVVAFDNTMRADTLLPLREALQPAHMILASEVVGPLRSRKSPAEIEALQRAAAMADAAMKAGIAACKPGVTEAQVAQAVEESFRAQGAELVDFVIVASGPNGAFPHHHTGQRALQPGDAVILDIGATLAGYKSDITRVVHLGPPSDEFVQVYEAVREAVRRATEAVRPGVQAREVDRAARGYLEEAGYGEHFVHRTGHGLGLEVHEPPYITAESETVLEPGMVFSIEPGVYIPDRFGVRIEDIVVVTEDGVRVLTGASRDLVIL